MCNTVRQADPEAEQPPPEDWREAKKRFPWLMLVIVVANTVMFIVTMYVNNCPAHPENCVARFLGRFSFESLKDNPLFGPSSETLVKMGAHAWDKVVDEHQGWRLVTCIWLHAGVLHLLANMLCLLVIGTPLEREFGFVKIGLLYLISGLGGNVLLALFMEPEAAAVGASGAIFGLLGGLLSELIMNWSIYTHKVAALLIIVTFALANLATGLLPHVGNFAHIGGFLTGIFIGFILLIRPQFGFTSQRYAPPERLPTTNKQKCKVYQYVLWVLSLVLLIVGFTFGIILALRGYDANKHCTWCRYLNCIPTKKSKCSGSGSCQYLSTEDQITVTCLTNMTRTYTLSSDATSSELRKLCNVLCDY